MSLGKDYLELINLMWNIEEIDMWIPQNHFNLAYVMDKLIKTDDYISCVEQWKKLAESKTCNELCWSIRKATVEFLLLDTRISTDEADYFQFKKNEWKERYDNNRLVDCIVLGIGDERYAPEWFMDLFNSYMPLKEFERDNAIKEYCKNECGLSDEETNDAFAKISRWYDIHNEFYFFVKNKRFKKWSPVCIQLRTEDKRVVTAEEICATTELNPLEAYLWMYSARENHNKNREEATKVLLDLQNK